MAGRFRVAIGGIWHETNTFSPVLTGYESFSIARGDAVLEGGLHDVGRKKDVELVPTFIARAVPSGLVLKDTYLRLKQELLEQFRAALPVDGVYLKLHGAMEVENTGDGESDLVSAVREIVGPEVLVAVSLDLHGNISPAVVEKSDMLTAFRTAPHRDEDETCRRALALLVRALEEELRPVPVMVKPPLLLVGEKAMTDCEPAKSLYSRLGEIDAATGIMDSSLLVGCAYTDSPFTSASVIVVAENDSELARAQARALAREVWYRRREFKFGLEVATVDDAIRTAMQSPDTPVFITDSGDNVTAGGAGDIPFILERLLALGAQDALVAGIVDPVAVAECAGAGVGAKVGLAVGGKLDPAYGAPLEVTGVVENLGATGKGAENDSAILRIGGVSVILTKRRRVFEDIESIASCGIEPIKQKIVVVKLGYLYPDLEEHAQRAIVALSPGSTNLDVTRLAYQKLHRPIFPLDKDLEWEP